MTFPIYIYIWKKNMFQTTKQINRPKTMIFQTSYSFVSFFNIHTPVLDVENPSSGLGPKESVPKPLSNCNWCFLILCSDLEQSMRLSIFFRATPTTQDPNKHLIICMRSQRSQPRTSGRSQRYLPNFQLVSPQKVNTVIMLVYKSIVIPKHSYFDCLQSLYHP